MPDEKPTALTLILFDEEAPLAEIYARHHTMCRIASSKNYAHMQLFWSRDTRDDFFDDQNFESVIIFRPPDEPLENPIEELQWVPQISRWIRHAIIDYNTPDDVLEGVVLRSIRATAPWNVMPHGSTIELVEVSDRERVIYARSESSKKVLSDEPLPDEHLPDAPIGPQIRRWNGAKWSPV